jgi:hypothetical protein
VQAQSIRLSEPMSWGSCCRLTKVCSSGEINQPLSQRNWHLWCINGGHKLWMMSMPPLMQAPQWLDSNHTLVCGILQMLWMPIVNVFNYQPDFSISFLSNPW